MRVVPALLLLAGVVGCDSDDGIDSGAVQMLEENNAKFPGFHFEKGDFKACGGAKIAWQTWTPVTNQPQGTFLFVNGRTEYTDKYHHLIAMLAEQNWTIVMYDQRGQGRSSGMRAHATDFRTEHVCDLDAVITNLVDESIPLGVATHSTGGLIASWWMQTHPNRVAAASFGSPLYGITTGGVGHGAVCSQAQLFVDGGQSENPSGDFEPRGTCEQNQTTHDCEWYEEFASDPLTEIGPATWGWIVAVCDLIEDVLREPQRISEPILIQQAGDDSTVENPPQDAFCAGINTAASGSVNAISPYTRPGGTCSLTRYEGAWHELYNEVEREQVMAETIAHLKANGL